MRIRMAMIAIAAAATAAVVLAQPGKNEQPAKPLKPAAAPVVLASANDVRRPSPAGAQRADEAVRRPAPRVTTCRCGDSQSSYEQSDDSQPDQ